ncbi:MAG: ABC transporter permease [Pseudomonadota bacterium]
MRSTAPAVFLLGCALVAVLAHWLPLEPNRIHLDAILQGPSTGFWLGTDELGRPVLERVMAGAGVSFAIALSVVALSAVVGITLGSAAALLGGWVDTLVVRIIDVFLAFPGILLAIALVAVLGPGVEKLALALALVGWVGFARLARAQVLSLKHREHVTAARALGARRRRILWRHLVPLMTAPLVVEATFSLAAVIIAEAGLSFLGLGIPPPAPSWGGMIREGSRFLLVAPHLALAPGILLMLVVLSVNLLGDTLRDRLDVKA